MSKKPIDIIRISFSEDQKINFGSFFSNVM